MAEEIPKSIDYSDAIKLFLAESVGNPPLRQVVGRQLYLYPIPWQDFDVVAANLSRNVGQNIKAIVQINSEHSVRQGFGYRAFHFNEVLLRQRNPPLP